MKALFLDIDGVLHPSTDILNSNIPRIALQGGGALRDIGLCRWAGLLEDALHQASKEDDENIALVVHSSWRNTNWATTQIVRDVLGPLGHRFIGFTQAHVQREKSIDDFIARASIEDHLIIDDAFKEFTPGRETLLVTNPLLGMSDESILGQVSQWATTWKDADLRVPMP